MNTVIESVFLSYQDARSDKVYLIELIEVEEQGRTVGYLVTAHNGRRGSNLTRQPKITTPTTYDVAKRTFDELEDKKRSPNYKTPYDVEWRNRPNTPSQTASRPASTAPARPQPRRQSNERLSQSRAAEETSQDEKKGQRNRLDMLEF